MGESLGEVALAPLCRADAGRKGLQLFQCVNAEPTEAFAARVRGAITRIAARHPDETVVVVSHGGVIGQVLAMAARTTGFVFTGSDNAAISHLVVSGDRWIIRRFNDTAHLGLALTTAPQPPT